MSRTSPKHLIALALAIAAGMAILTWRFYGSFVSIPWAVSVTLWLLVVVNVLAAQRVKGSLEEEHRIGLDRSQLDPMTVALFAATAKASAWTGSIIGGLYLGLATYVVPSAGRLDAAADDLPGVLTSLAGAVALVVAALYLERHCETPPPTDGEPAG
ncbi:DUF3180 domain-containing protein [Corynebacterium guangdongense]|uniref:DUF3180 domain-containing protein n=1 Tax=Corynebacterium guangdongense TaxID=1783348 RepID=A0ABU1ZZW2_9CORY|nr:DUF3180 domain-containing protein [Corynebacterium guangdongense]MDR7330305.1 hypothetical protein [Corynebacterium guangdongense]WJZ18863.1 hypothetical protein CGUA_11635 [Corynebacterium guangdongense]